MPRKDKKIGGTAFSSLIAHLSVFFFILTTLVCCVLPHAFPSASRFSASQEKFPNLVENGDLESYFPPLRRNLWRFDPEELFLWDAFSHAEGERSLFINAAKIAPGKFASCSYILKNLKPSSAYLFEVFLLRSRTIDGVYPVISLFNQEQRISDFWVSGDWQKITLFFKSPPKLTSRAQVLRIQVPYENYLLWLDDLSLRKFDVRLIAPGKKARLKEEFIDFSFEIPTTDRLLDIKIILSQSRNFQRSVVQEFKINNAAHEHLFSLDEKKENNNGSLPFQRINVSIPNKFKTGKWFWRVEVCQYKKIIAVSETRPFIAAPSTSAEERKEERMEVKSQETVIRNLDFFPVGIYGAIPSDFEELSRIGFNSVFVSSSNLDDLISILKKAEKNNIKVLSLPSPLLKILNSLSLFPDSQILFSDAVLGWYLEDEPEGRSLSPKVILAKGESLREAGFCQLKAIALNRSWRAVDYASATDVILADPYPVPFEPLSWLSLCLDEIHETFSGDDSKRVWAVVQAFDWNSVLQEIEASGLGREPTAEELRALTYLAVTHRAQGIFYYTYKSGNYFIRDKPDLWKGLKETVRELLQIFPLLISPEAEGKSFMECDAKDGYGLPAVHFIIKEIKESGSLREGIYLIAVNTVDKTVQAKIDLRDLPFKPEKNQLYFVDFFSGEKHLSPGLYLRLSLAPLERRILYISPEPVI